MIPFILRRLALMAITFIVVSVLIFGLTHVLPGDVTTMVLGRYALPEAKEALRDDLGLNRPLAVQYGTWLTDFLRGDMGDSLSLHSDVRSVVWERLLHSALLASVGLLMFAVPGIVLGLVAGLRQDTWLDHTLSIGSLAFIGLPEFVMGLVLIEVVAIQLGWLPASSTIEPGQSVSQTLAQLWLPGITVALTCLAYVLRMTRAGTVAVLRMDYVRTARLKGLPPHSVLFGHVLRNALMPTVTVIATTMGWLVGGLVITETVFNYPGIGSLALFAVQRRDIPLIQATAMVITLTVMLSNLAADVIYAYLNPKIRY